MSYIDDSLKLLRDADFEFKKSIFRIAVTLASKWIDSGYSFSDFIAKVKKENINKEKTTCEWIKRIVICLAHCVDSFENNAVKTTAVCLAACQWAEAI
jgi:hypothetical protein